MGRGWRRWPLAPQQCQPPCGCKPSPAILAPFASSSCSSKAAGGQGAVPLGASGTLGEPTRGGTGRMGSPTKPRGGPDPAGALLCGRGSGAARGRRNSSGDQTPSPTGHRRQNKHGSHGGAGSRAGEKIQFPPLFLDYYYFFFFFAGGEEEGERQGKGHKSQPDRGERSRGAGCRWGRPPHFAPSAGLGPVLPPVPPSSNPQPGLAPSCPAVGLSSPPLLNPMPSPPARGHPLALPELPGTSAQPRSQVPREHGSLQTRGNGGFIYGRSCNPSPSAAPWP